MSELPSPNPPVPEAPPSPDPDPTPEDPREHVPVKDPPADPNSPNKRIAHALQRRPTSLRGRSARLESHPSTC
jgi:hypothetical protein